MQFRIVLALALAFFGANVALAEKENKGPPQDRWFRERVVMVEDVVRLAIRNSLTKQIIEVNDEDTRERVRNMLDSYMVNLKDNKIVTSYEIICDETNNPSYLIEQGEMEIMIKLYDLNNLQYVAIAVAGKEGINVKTIEYWQYAR